MKTAGVKTAGEKPAGTVRGATTESLVLAHVRAARTTTLDGAAEATGRPRARVRLALGNLVASGEVHAVEGYATMRYAADAETAAALRLDDAGLRARMRECVAQLATTPATVMRACRACGTGSTLLDHDDRCPACADSEAA